MKKLLSCVTNEDCMELMARYEDDHFELAITDPPYGININKSGRLGKYGSSKNWDDCIPNDKYFSELFRVSKSQIIWGGNYFHLPPCKCFLIWDKKQPEGISFASCEMAWTSFTSSAKTFYLQPRQSDRFHPTQKPVALYDWIISKYAKEGDKILDTHLGSGSSRISAFKAGYDFVGCELDSEYFELQEKRFNDFISQQVLF